MTDDGRSVINIPEPLTRKEARRVPKVAHGISVLTNGQGLPDREALTQHIRETGEPGVRGRVQYAPMKAKMELAATALATGASIRMAAQMAGTVPRQVRKYLQSQSFRDRVEELRTVLMSQIHGRIITEFMKRTEPDKINKLEIMDLVRLFDRATGTGNLRGSAKTGDAEGAQKYELVIQSLVAINPGTQGGDFPTYGDEDLLLSSGDPSSD